MHRRKRGDTIRASDFMHPSVSLDGTVDSNSIATVSTEGGVGTSIKSTGVGSKRRTRSGTITPSKFTVSTSAPGIGSTRFPAVASALSGKSTLTSPARTHRRRHEGWPTIMMKIEHEPLVALSDGESEDELLLKAGGDLQ